MRKQFDTLTTLEEINIKIDNLIGTTNLAAKSINHSGAFEEISPEDVAGTFECVRDNLLQLKEALMKEMDYIISDLGDN